MPRYRLDIEYDGTGLVGWQRQDNGLSVQQCLEEAIFRFVHHPVQVIGAGRTDAGVHASGQVAHVDLETSIDPHTIINATNFHLRPHRIAVVAAQPVDENFHARFSAKGRRYQYRILNRLAPPVLRHGRVWHVIAPLNIDLMVEGARHLIGRHDFSSFRALYCQAKSPVKTLDQLAVSRAGDEVVIEAAARSFLHNQVRTMVGTLKLVGEEKWRPEAVKAALEARSRAAAGPTAPPEGLCLQSVEY